MMFDIHYLLQVILTSAIFATFFYLVMRPSTFFHFNRIFLLATMAGTVLLPLIKLPSFIPLNTPALMVMLDEVDVGQVASEASGTIDWFLVGYLTVVAVLLMRVILGFIAADRLLKRSEKQAIKGLEVYVSDEDVNPFSCFRRILINRELLSHERDLMPILKHECAHVRQGHSYDVLFSELMCSLFWFNPFFWLLKKELKSTHEYLADEKVLDQDLDLANYFMLIFNNLLGRNVGMTNNFNHSLNFKRMKMMKKKRSSRFMKVVNVMSLPVLLLSSLLLNAQADNTPPESSDENLKEVVVVGYGVTNDETLHQQDMEKAETEAKQVTGQVYDKVDKMPEYPGGISALMQFLRQNTKYPAEAQAKGAQGRVYVEFIVDHNGKVKDVSILKGVELNLDNEAIRVVKSMPDWTPGENKGQAVNVSYRLPINFALGKKKTE